MPDRGRACHCVGEKIINPRNPRARRSGAHLNRRGLAREDCKTVSGGMAGQIDEDINLIGLNEIAEFVVG